MPHPDILPSQLYLAHIVCRLALACVCVAILLTFLFMWVYYIGRALRYVSSRSYLDHRLGNLSIRIQASTGCFALTSSASVV